MPLPVHPVNPLSTQTPDERSAMRGFTMSSHPQTDRQMDKQTGITNEVTEINSLVIGDATVNDCLFAGIYNNVW